MGKRLQLSLDQLHDAWARRRRADWPADFTGAMAHPLLAGLVRAEALRAAQASQRAEQRATDLAAQPRPRQHRPARPRADLFDRKRAAAGERADD